MITPKKFHGIVPPVVTPFRKGRPGALDRAAQEKIVNRMIDAGVAGVFVLGTNGEQQSLGMAQRREVLAAAGPLLKGRARFYAGISDNSFDDIRLNIEAAAEAGADCVVLHPPSYFKLNRAELGDFFRRAAEMSPLPLMLYNIGMTGQLIPLDLVSELSRVKNIAGIKDSCGDMRYMYRLTAAFASRRNFSVFCGNDVLVADSLRNGADGAVPGGVNFMPGILCELYRAHLAGDGVRFDALREIVRQYDPLFWLDPSPSSFLKAAKHILSRQRLCAEDCMPPVGRIADGVRKDIDRLVAQAEASFKALKTR